MMGVLFHWIYCLPLMEAALLALCAAGLFGLMHRYWENRPWWRVVLSGLLLCWGLLVLKQTVWRSGVQQCTVSLIPFQCYLTVLQGGEKELIRSAFMNVLLFFPGGMLARCLWKTCPLWQLTLMFLLGSVAIECFQYGFKIGTAETDDVIHNTLGAFLGMLSAGQFKARQRS